MHYQTLIKTRNFKAGYVVKTGVVGKLEDNGDDIIMSHAETSTGDYIGTPKWAYRLCNKRGIKPELSAKNDNVCSIGFCKKEQKWYGWSHRAICGFGIGSKVKKGDCAYIPTDWDDFLEDAIRFWTSDSRENVTAIRDVDEAGGEIAQVEWQVSESVPKKSRRGCISGVIMYPPKEWGHGEWVAKTLADAKQMAQDFAEDID